jgi:hypothetical protein
VTSAAREERLRDVLRAEILAGAAPGSAQARLARLLVACLEAGWVDGPGLWGALRAGCDRSRIAGASAPPVFEWGLACLEVDEGAVSLVLDAVAEGLTAPEAGAESEAGGESAALAPGVPGILAAFFGPAGDPRPLDPQVAAHVARVRAIFDTAGSLSDAEAELRAGGLPDAFFEGLRAGAGVAPDAGVPALRAALDGYRRAAGADPELPAAFVDALATWLDRRDRASGEALDALVRRYERLADPSPAGPSEALRERARRGIAASIAARLGGSRR